MHKLSDIGNVLTEYSVKKNLRSGIPDRDREVYRDKAKSGSDLHKLILIEKGVIQDCLPYLKNYRVALEGGTIVICTPLTIGSSLFFGTANHSAYTPGTAVIILRVPGDQFGYILGSIPEFFSAYGNFLPDEIVSGANAGFIRDQQRYILATGGYLSGGIYGWQGSPLDILPGDFVQISPTGTAIFLDSFLAGLRATDFCSVVANYLDSLLRITGFNYQLWTSGSESYVFNHYGSTWVYDGYSYNSALQVGAKTGSSPILQVPEDQFQHPNSKLAPVEHYTVLYGETPQFSRFPVHLVHSWKGTPGQAGTHVVFTLKNGYQVPVAKNVTTAHGMQLISSSRAIVIAKYPFITAPLRASDPDEQAGGFDSDTVVQRNGMFISKVLGDKSFTGKILSIVNTSPIDIYNILANWESWAGFLTDPGKFNLITEEYISNLFRMRLKPGPGVTGVAFIILDDYGNICLRNNSGATIELRNGDIRISCPGTLYLDSGVGITSFSANQRHYAENGITLFGKRNVHLQVQGEPGAEVPDEFRRFTYRNEQFLRLDSTGVHRFTGVVDIDSISTKGIYMEACFEKPASSPAGPVSNTISYIMSPWFFEAQTFGNYVSATVASSGYLPSFDARTANQAGYMTTPFDVTSWDQLAQSQTLLPPLPDNSHSVAVSSYTLVYRGALT
ncbi:MAG: hypothetical protein KatS3mg087_0087 [Patescibacteria group bacterium]|nr:MAG: hypothetical protein KatS3mg087_0087 [Patescibacteria group bacterium]